MSSITSPGSSVGKVSAPGKGGHGFDPGQRHTKVFKNGIRCSSPSTYGVELGLVDPMSDNVTGCCIMSSVWGMILQ